MGTKFTYFNAIKNLFIGHKSDWWDVTRSEENEGCEAVSGAVIWKGKVATLAPSSGQIGEGSVACDWCVCVELEQL